MKSKHTKKPNGVQHLLYIHKIILTIDKHCNIFTKLLQNMKSKHSKKTNGEFDIHYTYIK